MINKRPLLLFILLLVFQAVVHSQPYKSLKGYFRHPLNIPMEIVANMGELRPNHWHMGLDIRTDQKENQPVFAAADGFIAHIGIRPQSFGRFIVIQHSNGLSTLYAHLNNFFPELEEFVTSEQYKQESWAIELDFTSKQFPVSKSQFIAYSGNTGGSQGPHLHFEIFETTTGKRLNPLLFGFPLVDDVAPTLVKLALYDRNKSVFEQTPKFVSLKNTDSGYIIPSASIIKTGTNKISFGIQAYDRISGSSNADGIYSAKLYSDNQLVSGFLIDSIDYNETAYMNAHIDYRYRYNGGAFYQHLSKLPGNRSDVYHPVNSDGIIYLNDTLPHLIKIDVRDAYNNISILQFALQYSDSLALETSPMPARTLFRPNEVNVLEKPGFEVYLPEGSLYDSIPVNYYSSNTSEASAISPVHQVDDPSYPVHEDIRVRIKPDKQVPSEWRDKLVIQRTARGKQARKAEWQGQWLSATFGDFGNFQAFADLQAPTINNLGKADTINLSPTSRIVFTPADNFGIKSFRAELDGQWLRFTNDKGRSWIYNFDERCPYGVHELKVEVIDLVGNTTTKSWWFKRGPYTPPKKKAIKKKSSSKKKSGSKKKKK